MDHYFDPQEIANFILWDYDVILTEGFKGSSYPKIEVHRREQGKELLTDPAQLLGVVTDERLDVKAPQFSHDDIRGIADLIEKTILNRQEENEVDLVVNGAYVPLEPSFKDLLARTIAAMIPAPANNSGIKNLHLSLRRKA
jgi:hypothetical protein